MLDSYGRDISYLRISVTDRCNLRCVYCMDADGVPSIPHERILSYESIVLVARAAWKLGFRKFRFTGGEPLVRRGFPELVRMVRAALPEAALAMTTNGTLLAPLAGLLRANGLDSVNVSLDTLDAGRYAELTRGGRVADALAGVRSALDAGLPVKLNTVVLPDTPPEDVEAVRRFAASSGAAFQTIRAYRLDQAKIYDPGYDRPPRCAGCDRIRLSASGELRPCLHSDLAFPVDAANAALSIERCVRAKPECGQACAAHAVNEIGG